MSCDNLRFLACLAQLIFQREIQYAINIITVLEIIHLIHSNSIICYLINQTVNFFSKGIEPVLGKTDK